MKHTLSERAGKLVIDRVGRNITLQLFYDTKEDYQEPHQQIPIFPDELDKLCEWWKGQKGGEKPGEVSR